MFYANYIHDYLFKTPDRATGNTAPQHVSLQRMLLKPTGKRAIYRQRDTVRIQLQAYL